MKREKLFGLSKLTGGRGVESFNDSKQCLAFFYIFSFFGSPPKSEPIFVLIMSRRCCYITVDFAMTASQNGLSNYKISLHKTNNIIDDKKFDFYCFHLLSKRSCETRSLYDPSVELCKHCFVMHSLQNPSLCSSTV
jgi:hypothetical protein